jgi:hypothetical protein
MSIYTKEMSLKASVTYPPMGSQGQEEASFNISMRPAINAVYFSLLFDGEVHHRLH